MRWVAFKWHLCILFKIGCVNRTGQPRKVHGSTYDVIVQPGEVVVFHHDDAPVGY